jgi:hypothetical protein
VVDVAIIEVGLGGRLDSTNCIRSPVVCGIAALGFDHMNILGHTLPVSADSIRIPAPHLISDIDELEIEKPLRGSSYPASPTLLCSIMSYYMYTRDL